MEKNESPFFLNNQSAVSMVSALHAAASIIKKSPGSISNTNLPFYPYVTSATLHSNQHHTTYVSTNSLKTAPTSVATPFGINDILGRPAATGVSTEFFQGNRAAPNYASSMATFENGFGDRKAAFAARAAAILFNNNHGIGCHGNQQGQMSFTGKPLTDLPGRPTIILPGVLNEVWHEKVGTSGLFKKIDS